jgi:hypothetical protein
VPGPFSVFSIYFTTKARRDTKFLTTDFADFHGFSQPVGRTQLSPFSMRSICEGFILVRRAILSLPLLPVVRLT